MGRIKSTMIKKAAKQLLQGENKFTESFEQNKKVLSNDMLPSKPIRNKVAGYIARLVKMSKEQKVPKAPKVQAEEVPQYAQYAQ